MTETLTLLRPAPDRALSGRPGQLGSGWKLSRSYVALAVCLAGCASIVFAQSGPKADYLLCEGDSIEIRFGYNAEMNDRVTIRPDGFISMAMIGDIRASGKTPVALGEEIAEAYQPYLRHPDAAIVVREFANRHVYITGEVQTPGVLSLSGPLTVMQAVANSGGARAAAALDNTLLLRYDGDNKATVRVVRLKQILRGKADDLLLQPYDVVYLPRTRIGKLDLFVEQYINSLVPRNLLFPYNL